MPTIEELQAQARHANQQGVRLDGGGDDRPPVYQTDTGTWVYRASAVGKLCHRALWLARTGHPPSPPPATLRTAFVQSANGEDVTIALAENRWEMTITGRQDTITVPVVPGVEIRGSIDGILNPAADTPTQILHDWPRSLIEIKCIRSEDWTKRGKGIDLYPGWREQVNLYMKGLGIRDGILLMGRKGADGVVEDVAYTNYKYQPRLWAQIRDKVIAVEQAVASGTSVNCSTETWGCPYWELHEGTSSTVDLVDDDQISILGSKIIRLQQDKKKTEREIADLKSQIDMWRNTHKVGGAVIVAGRNGRYKITVVEPVKKSLDTDRLAENGIDLDDYRIEQPGTPYLLITEDKDN